MGTRHCINCGQPGHDIRSCPVPLNKGQCRICGKRGHDYRNCPKR